MTVKVSTFLDVRASIFCMMEFVFEHVQFAGVWDPTQLPGQSAFDTDLWKLAFLLSQTMQSVIGVKKHGCEGISIFPSSYMKTVLNVMKHKESLMTKSKMALKVLLCFYNQKTAFSTKKGTTF